LSALLLDTHALLWWRGGDRRLSATARKAIEDGSTEAFFSAASIWEIAIKHAQGKLKAPPSLLETMGEQGFSELPITSRHAMSAGALPPHHRDPFDRMIVAQAQSEGLAVVTGDPRILAYGVAVVW
jgi:PIN domain nuclease of toxin-antitoxin system